MSMYESPISRIRFFRCVVLPVAAFVLASLLWVAVSNADYSYHPCYWAGIKCPKDGTDDGGPGVNCPCPPCETGWLYEATKEDFRLPGASPVDSDYRPTYSLLGPSTSPHTFLFDLGITPQDGSGAQLRLPGYPQGSGIWGAGGPTKIAAWTYEYTLEYGETDIAWNIGGTHLAITRSHRSSTVLAPSFGGGWRSSLDMQLLVQAPMDSAMGVVYLTAVLQFGMNETINFSRISAFPPFTTEKGCERLRLEHTQLESVRGYALRDTRTGYLYIFEPYFDIYSEPYEEGDPPSSRYCRLKYSENRYGDRITYHYDDTKDATSNISRIDLPGLVYVDLERDDQAKITTISDVMGRTVSYEYDEYDDLTAVYRQACGACGTGSTSRYAYDYSGGMQQLSQINNGVDTTHSYEYDTSILTKYIDPLGSTWDYEYSAIPGAYLHTVTDPNGTAYTHRFSSGVSGGEYFPEYLIYDPTDGPALTVQYSYDGSSCLTAVTYPDGSTVQNSYDSYNNLTCRTLSNGGNTCTLYNATMQSLLSYGFKAVNQVVDAAGHLTDYDYDSTGAVTRFVAADGGTTQFEYDWRGLRTKAIDATGLTQTYAYDYFGHLIGERDGLNRETNYTTDWRGNVLTTVRPSGLTQTRELDSSDRVTKITAGDQETIYSYDANGKRTLQTVTDGGAITQSTTWRYDPAGHLTLSVSPGGLSSAYSYDACGRLTMQESPSGVRTYTDRDGLGRVVTKRIGDGATSYIVSRMVYDAMGRVLSSYDAKGAMIEYEYDHFGRMTKNTNAGGHEHLYAFNAVGDITREALYDPNLGQTLSEVLTEYDGAGRVTLDRRLSVPGGAASDQDALSQTEYDGEGRILRSIAWTGASSAVTTTYDYDAAGAATRITDTGGGEREYQYDEHSLLTATVDARDNTTEYAYDAQGRQTKVTNASGSYTRSHYDGFNRVTAITQHDSVDNLLARTVLEFDEAGRQTLSRRKADPSGADNDATDHVERTFYVDDRVTTKRSASGQDTTYDYDSYGRQTKVTLPDGSYNVTQLDEFGQRTAGIMYEIVGGSTQSFETHYVTDALGQLTLMISQGPDGTYGNGDDLSTHYTYDGDGRQVTVTDAAGRASIREYDALGRATAVVEDASGVARRTEYDYDRAGRLITLTAYKDSPSTDEENTIYSYNERGQPEAVTYEETGTVQMLYDIAGNLTMRIDELGVTVAYAYDELNRLTERKHYGSTENINTFAFDPAGQMTLARRGSSANPDAVSESKYSYDALSRMEAEIQSIREGTPKTVSYAYDKAGNRLTLTMSGASLTSAYDYDSRNRCTQISVYDPVNTEWDDLADYTWLGNLLDERVTTCDYPGVTKPAFKTAFERDGLMRVTQVDNKYTTLNMADLGYDELASFGYTYDAAGNPLTETTGYLLVHRARADRLLTYDTLNRLTQAILSDSFDMSVPGEDETTTYVYDDLGNRVSHSYRSAAAIAYGHDLANRMTQQGAVYPDYNAAGDLVKAYSADLSESYEYFYDYENRLTHIAEYDVFPPDAFASFAYDAMGRRIEYIDHTNSTTTRYYYDGNNEIAEFDQSDALQRRYVHGASYIDERLMMYDTTTERPYYYALDRMYDVRRVVDRAGAVVERYMYDPYGRPYVTEMIGRGDMNNNVRFQSNDLSRFLNAQNGTIWDPRADINDDGDVDQDDNDAFLAKYTLWSQNPPVVRQAFSDVGNPFMFQGRPHFAIDTASDATEATLMLNDHRARFNDPVMGRWLTRDPAGYVDGMNLYEFGMSGPMTLSDPLGMWVIAVGGANGKGDGDVMLLAGIIAHYEKRWYELHSCRRFYLKKGYFQPISSPTGWPLGTLFPDWAGAKRKLRRAVQEYDRFYDSLYDENDECRQDGCPEWLHVLGFSDGASTIASYLEDVDKGNIPKSNPFGLVVTLDLVRIANVDWLPNTDYTPPPWYNSTNPDSGEPGERPGSSGGVLMSWLNFHNIDRVSDWAGYRIMGARNRLFDDNYPHWRFAPSPETFTALDAAGSEILTDTLAEMYSVLYTMDSFSGCFESP